MEEKMLNKEEDKTVEKRTLRNNDNELLPRKKRSKFKMCHGEEIVEVGDEGETQVGEERQ